MRPRSRIANSKGFQLAGEWLIRTVVNEAVCDSIATMSDAPSRRCRSRATVNDLDLSGGGFATSSTTLPR